MSDKENKIQAKVFRYDPSVETAPHYEDYEVPWNEQETILGVLDYIRTNYDPSIAYRDSCLYGCCAICIVKVNGKNVLACNTVVKEAELLIEPANRDKVLRDLAMVN